MEELQYPFSSENLIRKKKQLKEALLSQKTLLDKKIAILCGSTLSEVKDCLELFLLNNGIRPSFYISDYNKYYEEAVFENEKLKEFNPDIIYVFTSYRNIDINIKLSDSINDILQKINNSYKKYEEIWTSLSEKYNAIIIQNNFELPNYRLLGNKDISDSHGLSNAINKLNNKFYEYANSRKDFYICDINYIASDYGLSKWHNESLYALYKCPCDLPAMPIISFNVSNIIKSIYGFNKKALVLDLDNTLWGGILAEDGENKLKIGRETAEGEIYLAFQQYIKRLKDIGVVLNIASKNDEKVAKKALDESDGVLKVDDFVCIKANWDNKDENIRNIAKELNISMDSLAFIDDSNIERELVKQNVKGVFVPKVDNVENYINIIDHSGIFECSNLTNEDINKTRQYIENKEREEAKAVYKNYDEFLESLSMKAEIMPFCEKYYDRISQLSNKSNQFNMTTKRYSVEDIKKIATDDSYITLYGKLSDKFGDNGIVSLAIAKIENDVAIIELFLMSCRVLKRNMEYAMIDSIVAKCKEKGIKEIIANYIKTEKNDMVKDLFNDFSFVKDNEKSNGDSEWVLTDVGGYIAKCKHIDIN